MEAPGIEAERPVEVEFVGTPTPAPGTQDAEQQAPMMAAAAAGPEAVQEATPAPVATPQAREAEKVGTPRAHVGTADTYLACAGANSDTLDT